MRRSKVVLHCFLKFAVLVSLVGVYLSFSDIFLYRHDPESSPVSSAQAEYADPWYSTGWQYRKELRIDHTKVNSGDQTSFPVLVSLTDTDLISEGNGGHVHTDSGNDIIFTLPDGATKLDYEIESYDAASGVIVMWVKLPTLSSTADTLFYLYYGNTAISSSQENRTAVWYDGDSGHFKGVWHLKEDPSGTGAPMKDSTANANNGTTGGAMLAGQSVAGLTGKALSFDGSNDYVDLGNASGFNFASQMTISGWVKFDAGDPGGMLLYKWNNSVFSGYLITVSTNTTGYRIGFGGTRDASSGAGTGFSTGTWHQVGYTFGGGTTKIYVDGDLKNSTDVGGNTLGVDTNQHLYFSTPDTGSQFSGSLDEVRISDIARSPGWIKTEYNNSRDPSGFVTATQEEVRDGAAAVSNPVFSPSAGTYPYKTDVTIYSLTPGAIITYTTDGSDPAVSGTAVSRVSPATFTVVDTSQIRAMAAKAGYAGSEKVSASYTIRSADHYDAGSNSIIVDGPNDLHRICTDIADPSLISYDPSDNSYVLNTNIKILNSGSLTIQGTSANRERFIFNGPYLVWNRGELIIDNAVITSSNTVDQAQRGRILNRLWDGDERGWKFNLTNSDISYLGPGGLDENNETRVGIWGYAVEGSILDAKEDVMISNNHFSHIFEIIFGYVSRQVNVMNNDFTDFTIDDNTAITIGAGLVSGNRFYDNNLYIIVFSYGHPVIRDNRFWNNTIAASGAFIKHKEGSGGMTVMNNIIADDPDNPGTGWNSMPSGGFIIHEGASVRTAWSTIKSNIVNKVTGSGVYGIYINGNGYSNPYPAVPPGYDVLTIAENNTVSNVYGGIYLSAYANFPKPPDGPLNHAPRHVRLKNNIITGCTFGMLIDGEPYIDVVSENDSFLPANTASLAFGRMGNACAGQTPLFINTRYSTVAQLSGTFLPYQYIDVKVQDQDGNPVSGSTVTVTNEVDDITYPAVNLQGMPVSQILTGADGYTPLPSSGYAMPPVNTSNSPAVLDFVRTVSSTTQMMYTVAATKRGRSASVTGVDPSTSWYRAVPDTHANTIVLTLDLTGLPPENDLPGYWRNASWNYPNPVNFTKTDHTTIAYTVADKCNVYICLYSLAGELVKVLVNDKTTALGKYYIDWYGDNDGGEKAASGVYLYVAKIGKDIIRKKIVLLR